MNEGHCAPVPTIKNDRKWTDIAAQYHSHIASRKKDDKLYIAKGSLNVDDTNGSSQDGLQVTVFCSLPFTKRGHAIENPIS